MDTEHLSADRLDPEAMTALVNECYSDYHVPMTVTPEIFREMTATQDIDLGSSPVLLHDGRPQAFALLGVRPPLGWIGGMGVIPGARRAGLGRRVMERVLAAAHRMGLDRVDLEVIEENERAHRLYLSLGFRERRRLDVLERPAGSLPAADAAHPVEPIAPREYLEAYGALRAVPPPWQRARVVIERAAPGLAFAGVRLAGTLLAGVAARADDARVQILDVGLRPGAPAAALAAVLAAVLGRHPAAASRLVNLPAGDPAGEALRDLGFVRSLGQREMDVATAGFAGREFA